VLSGAKLACGFTLPVARPTDRIHRFQQCARSPNRPLDPLGLAKREEVPDLDLSAHGLTKSDLDTVFNTGNLAIGKAEATLSEMVESMEAIYCSSIGAEYMHIVDTKEKRWIQQRLEGARGQFNFHKSKNR
jgi:2-oxoglutarate dehydrogenase E1 component